MFSNIFPENRAVCEITMKNKVEPDRPHSIVRRMHIACWITRVQVHNNLLVFHGNNGYVNVPRCYVIPTLPFLGMHTFDKVYAYVACGIWRCTAAVTDL